MADAAEMPNMSDQLLCNTCGQVFKYKSSLKRHENAHEDRGPYRCCGRSFRDHRLYAEHRCAKLGITKRLECSVCNAKFGSNTALQTHNRAVHAEKKFKCTICGSAFAFEYLLKQHTQRGHGQVPSKHYLCECGKRYSYLNNLSRHRKTCRN